MECFFSRHALLHTLSEEIEQVSRWLEGEPEPAQIRMRLQALREAALIVGADALEKRFLELERQLLDPQMDNRQLGQAISQLALLISELECQHAEFVQNLLESFDKTTQFYKQTRNSLWQYMEQLQTLATASTPADHLRNIATMLGSARSALQTIEAAHKELLRTRDELCLFLAESTRVSLVPLFASLREKSARLFIEKRQPGILLAEGSGLRLPLELVHSLEKVLQNLLEKIVDSLPSLPSSKPRNKVASLKLYQTTLAGLPVFELQSDSLPSLDWHGLIEQCRTELTLLRAMLTEREDEPRNIRLVLGCWCGLDQALLVDTALGRCWLRVATVEGLVDENQELPDRHLIGPPTDSYKHLAIFRWEGRNYHLPVNLREPPHWIKIELPSTSAPRWLIGETASGQPVLHPWPWLPRGKKEKCLFPEDHSE